MAGPASPTPLSPSARAAWRRAADELLIDAIFGERTHANPHGRAPVVGAARYHSAVGDKPLPDTRPAVAA